LFGSVLGEVFPQCSVELCGLLEGHSMARVVKAVNAGVGNAFRQSIRLRRPNQDVFSRANEKSRQIDLRKARLGRVSPYCIELAQHRSESWRVPEAYIEMRADRVGPDRFEKIVGIEQTWQRTHPVLGTAKEPLKEEPQPSGRREGRDPRATVRRDQRQTLATVCGTKGELLRDHAPHRHAHDVGPIPTKVVEDPDRVVGHRRNRSEERSALAIADAQVIVVATPMISLQFVDLRPPNRTGHPEPHDEEDGRPLRAEDLVRQPRARRCKVLAH